MITCSYYLGLGTENIMENTVWSTNEGLLGPLEMLAQIEVFRFCYCLHGVSEHMTFILCTLEEIPASLTHTGIHLRNTPSFIPSPCTHSSQNCNSQRLSFNVQVTTATTIRGLKLVRKNTWWFLTVTCNFLKIQFVLIGLELKEKGKMFITTV